jgi:hypothetical protein
MVPLWLAGSVTVVALVGLGIFLYPQWLRRPSGRVLVAAITLALAVLFWWFDGGRTPEPGLRVALALLWAAAPAFTGWIVSRIG